MSWTPGTQRSLVMIGDAIPHPPSYSMNTLKLDWKTEAKKLHDELGVKIYAVQVCETGLRRKGRRGKGKGERRAEERWREGEEWEGGERKKETKEYWEEEGRGRVELENSK